MNRARVLAAVLVLSWAIGPSPAAAAPQLDPPSTVRVNVAGLGVTRAVVGATSGTLTVTHPDGRVLYRGVASTIARRDVRRVASSGAEVPFGPAGFEGVRESLRDSRLSEVLTGSTAPALVTNRLELATAIAGEDAVGIPLFSSTSAFTPIRYASDTALLVFNGRTFRGTLEIATDDEGDMIVVNSVGTSDYLKSVVGSEIPNGWEPAALAAQAVAARTYLATRLAKHAMYDLEGDTRDQAYDGIRAESAASIRAVQLTAGLVATYRGAPIEAYYSANAGGVTEDGANVFPGAGPYLRSVASPADVIALTSDWGRAGYQWTQEMTARELGDLMASRGLSVGRPEAIELMKTSPTGRVMEARVTGRTAVETVPGDRTRRYFGLLSTLYTVTLLPTSTVEEVGAADTKRIAELEEIGADLLTTAYRRTVTAERDLVALTPTSYRYKHPNRFRFSGRGFGHGVGMSQWGMQGMALGGASFEQILKHYYTGIELTNVGGG